MQPKTVIYLSVICIGFFINQLVQNLQNLLGNIQTEITVLTLPAFLFSEYIGSYLMVLTAHYALKKAKIYQTIKI